MGSVCDDAALGRLPPKRSRKISHTMIASKTIAFTVLSAALAAAPAVASAASTTGQPIAIDESVATGASDHAPQPQVFVSFTNQDARTATDVVFVALHDGQIVDSYDERGQFSPGAEIATTFDDLGYSPEKLKVASVTFADGTTWNAPDLNLTGDVARREGGMAGGANG